MRTAADNKIIHPGQNCWRVEQATRAAFLVDAAEYFKAFAAAVRNAQRSIYIVGWDIHSKTRLFRGADASNGEPTELRDFLNAAVSRNKDLLVNLLIWDFAMVFLLEREVFPVFQLDWKTSRRIDFHLDSKHPIGASHHQKIVVIDDRFAFVGGLDLTQQRWDTQKHLPEDSRRKAPGGTEFGPYHDVQLAVEGPVAAALGDLIRTRWKRATGKTLEAPVVNSSPWPDNLEANLNEVDVGIARTEAAFRNRTEVREVERLYLDMIKSAQKHIYIENQYLTSHRIAEAIADSLQQKQGPEIVIVTSNVSGGWLEQASMGVRRLKFLDMIRSADKERRLRVMYPVAKSGDEEELMKIHAKVMVADDRFLRIGSANLTNRSMGFDTECDLAIEAENDNTAGAIRKFRNHLLGHQLGVHPKEINQALQKNRSLVSIVDNLGNTTGRLKPLESDYEPIAGTILPDQALLDPERPLKAERLLTVFNEKETENDKGHSLVKLLGTLLVLLAIAAIWRFTSLHHWTDPTQLSVWVEPIRQSPLAPLFVVAGFVVGGMVMLPVTALIASTALVFGPWFGFLYALAGTLASAVVAYGIGKWLWRDALRRLAGDRLNRLSRDLDRQGILVIAAVRLIPIAPFTVVNLVAGSSGIRFRNYFLGTLVGMAPGMLVLSLFADRVAHAVQEPTIVSVLTAIGVLVLLFVVSLTVRRLAKRKIASDSSGHQSEDPA